MKVLQGTAFVLVAIVLQSVLTRLVGHAAIDLVLVAVVSVALLYGGVAGLASGTVAGLLQDALGGGVLGLSGLGLSVSGFLAGVAGTQFIVTQSASRALAFFGASALNGVFFVGLSVLLGLRHYDRPYLDVALPGVANAAVGVLLLRTIDLLPAAREWWRVVLERRRKRRYH